MSRIGLRILPIPEKVSVEINKSFVKIIGPLGTLDYTFSDLMKIEKEGNSIKVTRANEDKHTKQLHGTTNSLILGMLTGVSKGFVKEIIIKGVGYKAILKGDKLEVNVGYSHLPVLTVPKNVKVELAKPTEIKISGIDKQAVGQMAALIRNIRRPNPYTGKGIMYKGEIIIRKEGKSATK